MAVREVREYYAKLLAQYQEMNDDLADWNEAVKAGNVTEDQLADVKADVERLRENVERIHYVLYLLEKPSRKSKKARFDNQTKKVDGYFRDINAHADCVFEENDSIVAEIHKKLKAITEAGE